MKSLQATLEASFGPREENLFSPVPPALLLTAYGLLFLAGFHIGRFFLLEFEGSLWYLGAGLRMAVLLLCGHRILLPLALVELAAIATYSLLVPTIFTHWQTYLPIVLTTLLYGAGCHLLGRLHFNPRLNHLRDVVSLVATTLILPLIVVSITRTVEYSRGALPPERFAPVTLNFWIGDTIGIFLLTPLLLLLFRGIRERRLPTIALKRQRRPWSPLIADSLLVALAIALLHFIPESLTASTGQLHWYFTFLPIVWISFRHGLPGSIAGIVVTNFSIAALMYLSGRQLRLQELQILLIMLSMTGLLMGASISAQRQVERRQDRQYLELVNIRDQLRTKNEELSARNQEMERFVKAASHDLKNPLVTISGYLGHLEQSVKEGAEAQIQGDIDRIHTAANTMDGLLDGLLELWQIGQVGGSHRPVALSALARRVAGHFLESQASRGVDIHIADTLPTVNGNPERLQQVFFHLIENALKFSPLVGPKVEIGRRDDSGEPVFFVRDRGIGIDPKYHTQVFGLFNQLDQRKEGSGIGLSLVERIIAEHGGRVWVESEGKSNGTTVCFTLNHDESTHP